MKKIKVKTLFFIGIILSIILLGTSCLASSGQINTSGVTIGEGQIEELKPMMENILGYVQVIGSAISVITVVVIGIKYIWASTEEKVEIKQTAIYYVIGAVLLFSAVNIVTIAYNVLS